MDTFAIYISLPQYFILNVGDYLTNPVCLTGYMSSRADGGAFIRYVYLSSSKL